MGPSISRVKIAEEEGAWVITLPAEVRAEVEDSLIPAADQALAGATRPIIVDLSAVTIANSAGIGALVVLIGRANRRGAPIVFAGARGLVLTLLERAGLTRQTAMADSVEAALLDLHSG